MSAKVPIIVATPQRMQAAMKMVTDAQDLLEKGDVAGAKRNVNTVLQRDLVGALRCNPSAPGRICLRVSKSALVRTAPAKTSDSRWRTVSKFRFAPATSPFSSRSCASVTIFIAACILGGVATKIGTFACTPRVYVKVTREIAATFRGLICLTNPPICNQKRSCVANKN